MKKKYILIVVLLLLLPVVTSAEENIPDVKNSTIFQGRVTVDGNVAPDGTIIEAKAGTVLRGSDYGGTSAGNYNLAVFSATETLTFYINGRSAQTYSLLSTEKAMTIDLDLSVSTSSGSGGGGGGSGSSGGGGGGGGPSGEDPSNIELIEKYDLEISKDVLTSYKFTHAKNPIKFVNVTGVTSSGLITTSVEVLKGTSSLVKSPPKGKVHKNVNIWMGTSGFATPKNIKNALIDFRVDNAWMSSNSVPGADIVLSKWDGNSWIQLETRMLSKDDVYTYFEGKTDSFSPFAITTKEEAPTPTVTTTPAGTVKPTVTPLTPPAGGTGILTWLIVVILILIIGAGVYFFVVKKNKKE